MMKREEAGFTLVELLVAMAIFSFMLLIVTAGFLQIVRIQQSGVASRTTQQNARLVMDGVVKDIRQAAQVGVGGAGQLNYLCLSKGSQALEYAVDGNGDLRVGVVANPAAGTCPAPVFAGWRTLNDSSVKLTQFRATTTVPLKPSLGTASVVLTVVSRNNLNALDATQTHCTPGSGSQFCAVTTLSSGAALRGGDGL